MLRVHLAGLGLLFLVAGSLPAADPDLRLTGTGPAAIHSVQLLTSVARKYEKLELAIELDAEYQNPFDPADISLEAHFVTPSGQEQVAPGFLWWECERSRQGGSRQRERVVPTGIAQWRVRFCPTLPGEYRYWLVLDDGTNRVETKPARFVAADAEHAGLVRVAKGNRHYFEHDDGTPYFPIGENVCWSGPLGTYEYDNYWRKLSEHGANYARLWVGPFDLFTLERSVRNSDDPAGPGRYDLVNSWRLDYVVELAQRCDLKLMYCIESFNSLRSSPMHARWDSCPYNVANGGPCQRPEEFFTNSEAKRLFKQRLRYIVARWSYSPAILSWEFWNEVNIIEKYISKDSVAWHREMARYLRELDLYDHLITTSWAGVEGDPLVDALPEMDYIQSHQYGARDAAAFMIDVCHDKFQRFEKPHYFGEFGTGTQAEGTREDTDGIHLHNGLWSGVVSGAAGAAMIWWWDSYVEPLDLYYHFQPVAEFVRDVPFNRLDYRPAVITSVEYAGTPPPPRWETLDINPQQGSWTSAPYNKAVSVTAQRSGNVDRAERLSRVLHGVRNHPTLHNPVTFHVDYAQEGRFVVVVAGVSGHGGAKLKVYLDQQLKIDQDLADTDDSKRTLTQYNGQYAVTVPPGKHEIRVVNDGNDWLFVGYRLTNYRLRTQPALQAYGLVAPHASTGQPAALVWIKNEHHTWFLSNQGEELVTVPATCVTVAGISDGSYDIEWWDTYTGRVTHRDAAQATGGNLTLEVRAVTKDVACRVKKRSSTGH